MKLNTMSFESHSRIGCLTLKPSDVAERHELSGCAGPESSCRDDSRRPAYPPGADPGAGRAFSTGVDLKQLSAGETPDAYYEQWDRALRILEQAEKVLVCSMHGYTRGGGFQLALACDIRMASSLQNTSVSNASRWRRQPVRRL